MKADRVIIIKSILLLFVLHDALCSCCLGCSGVHVLLFAVSSDVDDFDRDLSGRGITIDGEGYGGG
jgi:hypothetical protein